VRLFCFACAALVVGCGPTLHWYKDGLTQASFSQDRYECERDTRMAEASFRQPRQPDSRTGYQVMGNSVVPYQQYDAWAGISNLGATLGEVADRKRFFQGCMEARGYVLKPAEEEKETSQLSRNEPSGPHGLVYNFIVPSGVSYEEYTNTKDFCASIVDLLDCMIREGYKLGTPQMLPVDVWGKITFPNEPSAWTSE
jgi:hypothetical protein